MDLREYLFHKRLSIKEFGEMVDCTRPYISAVVHGRLIPSIRLAKSIETVTNGEVTAESLLKKKEGKVTREKDEREKH